MTTSPQPESPEPLKVVAHMRADGSAWNGYASCRPGDVEAFAVTRLSDATAAIQAARNEAEAMRAVIDAHNAECESMCEQRQQSGDSHCPFAKYGRQCPDCPRDGMLNIAMKGGTSCLT